MKDKTPFATDQYQLELCLEVQPAAPIAAATSGTVLDFVPKQTLRKKTEERNAINRLVEHAQRLTW